MITGAAAALAVVGLIDDMYTLGPLPRLAAEALAASAAFAAGARTHLGNDLLDWALTVAWLVVLTNAFNLLDNLDGCASAVGMASGTCLTLAAALEGQELVGAMAALVTGACGGFFVHNRHPAKVFMGDAGSLLLGFLLATTALKLRWPGGHAAGLAAVVLIAALALFDTTLVVISRLRARRRFYVGGTDHTSHRLVLVGMPSAAVPTVLAVVAAGCGLVGVAVGRGALPVGAAVVPLGVAGVAALWSLLRVPVYGQHRDERLVEPVDLSRRTV